MARKTKSTKAINTPKRAVSNLGNGTAILPPLRGKMVYHQSSQIEGVHFDLLHMTPREIGYRALSISFSGIAELGAEPKYSSVALGIKQGQGDVFTSEILAGASQLAAKYKVKLVAEEIFDSPSFVVLHASTLAHTSRKPFSAVGAKPGDILFVTGTLGDSAAGLALIKRLGRKDAERHMPVLQAHVMPVPCVKVAQSLQRMGVVTSMRCLREGLARDIYQMAEQTGVGLVLDEAAVPCSEGMLDVARFLDWDPTTWALYGGEDFQLLFTLRPRHRERVLKYFASRKVKITPIGEVQPQRDKILLRKPEGELVPLVPRSWTHLARRAPLKFQG